MNVTWVVCAAATVLAQDAGKTSKPAQLPDLPAFKQAGSQYTLLGDNVWLEKNDRGRRVLMCGTICRREASLEEFACLKNTKEHEAIVSLDITPRVLHAALLAAGA